MRTIEKIIVPPTLAHEKEVLVYVCDICGRKSQTSVGTGLSQTMGKCVLCGRHVCRRYAQSCAKDDPECWGDYPDVYCPICYKIKFVTYLPERQAMEKRHEAEEEELDRKMREESLATKPEITQ